MTQEIANEVITAEANTLELEGKALATIWKGICKATRVDFDCCNQG